jgi:lipopolysaccharide export system permease protein
LLRELRTAFVVGIAMSTFVLIVMRIMDLVDLAFARGVPASQVLALFGYMLPSYLELTLPMALLLSLVVTFARATKDGELVALYSSGLNLRQIARPVFGFAFLVAVACLALSLYTRPWATRRIEETTREMARTRFTAALRPGVFSPWLDGLVIYVGEIDADDHLRAIMLADEREAGARRTIFAHNGELVTDDDAEIAYLRMKEGTILKASRAADSYDKTDFSTFELTIDFDPRRDEDLEPGALPPHELNLSQLLAARRESIARTGSAVEEDIEIQRKIVIPAGTLLLPLIAIPLGVQRSRAVRSRGLIVSVVIILLYYMLTTGAVTAARQGTIPATLAMWLPNIILGAVGITAFTRALRDKRLFPRIPNPFSRRKAARTAR